MANNAEDSHLDLNGILEIVAQSENLINYDIFPNKTSIEGDGFLSEILTGQVFNKDTGETSHIVIKNAPIGFKALELEPLYKNEIHFYSKIFPELDQYQREKGVRFPFSNIPRYVSGRIDTRNMFVAMEDLKIAGYTLSDKKQYLNSDQLSLIFKIYGKFHALSFAFKQENPEYYENLVKDCTNILSNWTNFTEFLKYGLDAYASALETFDSETEADILKKLTKFDVIEALKDVELYKGSYRCLTHGDCWSNNMLFKYKESGKLEDVKIFDFQGICSNTPIHDLAYYFYSGAAKKDMDKLYYYLDLYYKSFSDFAQELGGLPDKMFPLEVLKKEWKHYGFMGIFLGCQIWAMKLIDKEEIKDVLSQKDLPQETYWEKWNEILIRTRQGAEYRERARNICLHAVEYGILM